MKKLLMIFYIIVVMAVPMSEVQAKVSSKNCVSLLAGFLTNGYSIRKQNILKKDVTHLVKKMDQFDKLFFSMRRNPALMNVLDLDLFTFENDEIVVLLKKIFKKVGVKSKITRETLKLQSGKKITFRKLEFVLDEYSNSYAFSKLSRFARTFKVDKVEFNLLGMRMIGAAGGFSSGNRSLAITDNTIIEMLMKDIPDFVINHEMAHAAFNAQRLAGKSSIYHRYYYAIDGNPLETLPSSTYAHYISAEELYNYSANMFWILRDIKDFSHMHHQEQEEIVKQVEGYFKSVVEISSQIEGLTRRTKSIFQEVSQSEELLYGFKWSKDSRDGGLAYANDEILAGFGSSYIKEVEKYDESVERFAAKNGINFKEINSMNEVKELVSGRTKGVWTRLYNRGLKLQRKVFETEVKKQEELGVVGDFYKNNTALFQVGLDRFMDTFAELVDKTDEASKDVLNEAFKNLKRDSKSFANYSRENYKGYIAKK